MDERLSALGSLAPIPTSTLAVVCPPWQILNPPLATKDL